ncbi:arginine/ornithine transport system permease protein [Faunimonas pinastri]|uniref:Arginine/ornithine transport system permease protein n=1 Tax=Faunimonas pinastri TaxID=1855383 RepID=A0A1H9B0Z4_9HYPH|nr:ABC transporter permease subunit [Faunimonas pinastri]SEP82407.1 arginine/ornithine transport system permease protein [Faunimonas pinastri]
MPGGYVGSILAAGGVTLSLAFVSLLLAVLIGMAGAFAKLSSSRPLRMTATVYTSFIRGIPDLVMMLLVFYSVPALLNQWVQGMGWDMTIEFSPFGAGAATLALIFGAYMTETFRGALMNIPKGQLEAAQAYGLARPRIFWRILLPQMMRLALPGFTNNWLVMTKATALVSLLGVQDVMFRARGAAEATGKPFSFYILAGGFYLAITAVSLFVLSRVARRYEAGVKELAR